MPPSSTTTIPRLRIIGRRQRADIEAEAAALRLAAMRRGRAMMALMP
jgi:hypothetical protein